MEYRAFWVAQTVKNAHIVGDDWVGKIPWRRAWQYTPVFLPGESHGQRSLVGYSQPGGSQRVRHDLTTNTHTQVEYRSRMVATGPQE